MSKTNQSFDIIVIGGGPGGYVAAIRAAQLGFNTACIDAASNAQGAAALGGTCTNVGCIPSKALLQSSEHYEHAGHAFAEHGIEVKALTLNLAQMLARKDAIIKQNNEGIFYLFKKNKVSFFHGHAAFVQKNADETFTLQITSVTQANQCALQAVTGKHIIIATGSHPRALPGVLFDEKYILSNEGALAIPRVPKTLGIIGAGVIGLEMGSVWRRLGSDVTVLEANSTFLEAVDEQIAREAQTLFAKQGLKIHFGVKINAVVPNVVADNVSVNLTHAQGAQHVIVFDRLIVSIGRTPNTKGLCPEAIGLTLDTRGFIVVDDHCATNISNVWAIGDVVRGPMLAHKAEEEGVAVAERIAGQQGHIDFNLIPWVIYTSPEVAWVGRTEQQLKKDGVLYKSGVFPFLGNGRARALGNTVGMVKFLADAVTDEILGVHIIGPVASELISEAVTAMAFRASSEDIARICHAHPSLSEATKEAALAVAARALNY